MPSEPTYDPASPPNATRVGPVDDAFEHYRIFRREDGSLWELGHGAMGVTYKAVDTNLDKPVALKIINAQSFAQESARKRFRREARAAASLHHRHIATVFHLGESSGNFFYAMEFVDGQTVERLVKRDGPLPWRAAVAVTVQVTRALMAAHAKGLVHRDIKPSNIMIVDEVDEHGVVKLIDFGLAKSAVEADGQSSAVTNASGFLGTPLYASPEQCEELPADVRSDIYSLGVTLWFMLTGEPTFQGTLGKVFHQQMYAAPPWDKLPADLPPAVRKLLERMLAKDRAHRPQNPTELRAEAEACLGAPGVGGGLSSAVASAGFTLEKSLAEMLKSLAARAAGRGNVPPVQPATESNGGVGGSSRRTTGSAPAVPAGPIAPAPVPSGPVAGTPLSGLGNNGAETLVEGPTPTPVIAGGPVNPPQGQSDYPPDPTWRRRKWGIVAVVIALVAVLAFQDKSDKSSRTSKAESTKKAEAGNSIAEKIRKAKEIAAYWQDYGKKKAASAGSRHGSSGEEKDADTDTALPAIPTMPGDSAGNPGTMKKVMVFLEKYGVDSDDLEELKAESKSAGMDMLQLAVRAVQKLEDPVQRAKALTGIASTQSKLGQAEPSARTFVLATQAAESIPDVDAKIAALREVTGERGKSLEDAAKKAVPLASPVAAPMVPPIPEAAVPPMPAGSAASPAPSPKD